jgi:hypothetical protein
MGKYEDAAALFDKLAEQHEVLADLLTNKNDPKHKDSKETIAQAERAHADACRRAAGALRSRA